MERKGDGRREGETVKGEMGGDIEDERETEKRWREEWEKRRRDSVRRE